MRFQHPFARTLVTVRTWPFFIDVGVAAIGLAAIGVVTAGLLTAHWILRYLAAARPVASLQLAPEPDSLVPESRQKS